jgi:signal transduction histidine kinase
MTGLKRGAIFLHKTLFHKEKIASSALAIVLIVLACIGYWGASFSFQTGNAAEQASALSRSFEEARFSVAAEESLERKYRLEPSAKVRERHRDAGVALLKALKSARELDKSFSARVDALVAQHDDYLLSINHMFAAIDAGDSALANEIDGKEVDPKFDDLQEKVFELADQQRDLTKANLDSLASVQSHIMVATPIVLVAGLVLVALCWSILINAVKARAETLQENEVFKNLNSQIARANMELADRMKQLNEAREENLRKAKMAQLGQLTATVAHELRNPLSTCRTSAYVIERKISESGLGLESQLARMNNGISRCDTIITQLLDYARTGKPDFVVSNFDEWLAKTLEEEAEHLPGEIELICNLGLDGKSVAFDPSRIRRVIINLLSNASEAMVGRQGSPPPFVTKSPRIIVSTRVEKSGIQITVSDNGPGMSEEVLAKVNEPMFTTKSFGTGLGIPAIEKILEEHGGSLEIASKPGEGAQFTARLPIDQSLEAAA